MKSLALVSAIVVSHLCLLAAPAMSDDGVIVTGRGTNAVPIEREPPQYPTGARYGLVEGWVVVSYVIDTDGTTRDIEIVDASIENFFDRAAVRAVQKWTFKPATFNGEPVQQAKTSTRLVFVFEDSDGGVSRDFLRRYKRAFDAIQNDDLDRALSAIKYLERRKQGVLAEVCYLDILRAMYWQKKGDEELALRFYERALMIADDVAEEDIYVTILKQALVLSVRQNHLVEALTHYHALTVAVGELPEEDRLRTIAEQVQEYLDSDKPYTSQIEVHQHCSTCENSRPYGHHTLYRDRFSIDEIDGAINEFKLLCGFQYVTIAFTPDTMWKVEDDWGQCNIHVYGDDGTKFRLVEH